MKEFELIEKIKNKTYIQTDNINIGDDCAILKNISNTKDILITTDILIDKVHFNLEYYTFYDVGYKSAQVNISDIICKGAIPTNTFISISIPKHIEEKNILEWYDGFLDASKKYNIEISGGDTTLSKNSFFISITMLGEIEKNKAILRSNAKINDNVYILGNVGESDIGLQKLLNKNYDYNDESIKIHLRPILFFEKWQYILKNYSIHSSIDISDGLLQDASHIAKKSNVYIEIYENSNWNLVNRFFNNDPKIINSILTGGEDYAILFTTPEEIKEENNLIKIGRVKEKKEIDYISYIDKNNSKVNFKSLGYNHF